MDTYWEIRLRDKRVIQVPPASVQMIQKRMDARLPIHTAYSGSFPSTDIVAFEPTDRPFTSTPLLEEASRIFREPMLTDDGIISRWVKKEVPLPRWERHYAPLGYARLRETEGRVIIAWRLPTHLIDVTRYQPCTDDEVTQLERTTNGAAD